eukprot:8773411-Lingulodinium_polyedra.AAC.1
MYFPYEANILPATDEAMLRGERTPTLAEFGDDRITVCVYRNGESSVLKDQWRSSLPQRLPLRGWV